MLKLFLLERGALVGYPNIALLIAAEIEKEARTFAAEQESPGLAILWICDEKMESSVLTAVTLQTTFGARCREIGTAAPDVKPGVIQMFQQQGGAANDKTDTKKPYSR